MKHTTLAAQKPSGEAFIVAGWRVDPAALRISYEDRSIRLEPKAMAVLDYLACRPGKVVPRLQLEQDLWAGTVVGYDALSNTIIKLRKAFGDKARTPRVIETIPKTGYRLIGEVTRLDEGGTPAAPVATLKPGPADRPSIVVLPFDNMSGDRQQEYFSDGLSEDITTDLSKLPGFLVIARNSAFAYKGRPVDLAAVSRDLGVRYALEGSVRKSGERVRINAQLIDCTTGGHLWAERYDRDLTDIFSVQDEVTRKIVAAISPSLTGSEQVRLEHRETADFAAYDYFLKGREYLLLDTEESNRLARELLQKAIDLDPQFSSAWSFLARCVALDYINNWSDPSPQAMTRALELGRKAIELNPDNPHAHFSTATVAFWMGQHDIAMQELGLALKIDPNFAEAYGALAMIQVYSGNAQGALDTLQTTMRLDPFYRDIYLHFSAQAYFHLRRYSEAIEVLKRRLVRKPDSDISRVLLASCYGHLGKIDKCRKEWSEALQINPRYSLRQKRKVLPYSDPRDFEQIVDGLRLARIDVDG